MIEVHLIGYTADLRHLVLDVDANEERGRYRLVVDGDLFATLDDMRQQRWEHGLDVGGWVPEEEWEDEAAEEAWEEPAPEDAADEAEAAPVEAFEDATGHDPAEDEDDLLADLEDSAPLPEPREPASAIRPLDRDERLFDDDEDDGGDDDALEALLDRVSVDSDDDAPAVRLVPAPPRDPEPEPEPAPVAADPDPEPEVDLAELEDDEWEWVEESAEVVDDPAAEEQVAQAPEDIAEVHEDEAPVDEAPAPTPRARNSDIPTALPSQLAKRKTAAGLEIPQNAKLTPAEIQAELRKGRSVRAVAKAAGTDPAWVKRWLQPIEAEQTRIIQQAQQLTVTSRKGQVSALPLADAVDVRLTRRKVDPASAKWDAVRREDGTWRISCRFEEKGKVRTASWLWARGETRLSPASELAREVGWVDRRLAAKR